MKLIIEEKNKYATTPKNNLQPKALNKSSTISGGQSVLTHYYEEKILKAEPKANIRSKPEIEKKISALTKNDGKRAKN